MKVPPAYSSLPHLRRFRFMRWAALQWRSKPALLGRNDTTRRHELSYFMLAR
jgi:hypothetical protein